MTDISIDSSQAADDLLGALGEQLAAQRECFTIAVVGGSALLALGLVSRATRDVDVLAIVDGEELTSAQPLLDAASWSQTHDPSDGYRSVLARVLDYFGIDDGSLGS